MGNGQRDWLEKRTNLTKGLKQGDIVYVRESNGRLFNNLNGSIDVL